MEMFPYDQKNMAMSTYHVLWYRLGPGIVSKKKSRKHLDEKGRSKIISICKGHDLVKNP